MKKEYPVNAVISIEAKHPKILKEICEKLEKKLEKMGIKCKTDPPICEE